MRDWIFRNLDHILCYLILVTRLGDLLSAWLVTPKLSLEANPIVRKLGWRFAFVTILVCFLPYVTLSGAVTALVAFLLVCASNFGKVWVVRSMGEERYQEFLLDLAREGRRVTAYLGLAASVLFMLSVGALLMFFYPDPVREWAFWIALGIVVYAAAAWLYGALFLKRLFEQAEDS